MVFLTKRKNNRSWNQKGIFEIAERKGKGGKGTGKEIDMLPRLLHCERRSGARPYWPEDSHPWTYHSESYTPPQRSQKDAKKHRKKSRKGKRRNWTGSRQRRIYHYRNLPIEASWPGTDSLSFELPGPAFLIGDALGFLFSSGCFVLGQRRRRRAAGIGQDFLVWCAGQRIDPTRSIRFFTDSKARTVRRSCGPLGCSSYP